MMTMTTMLPSMLKWQKIISLEEDTDNYNNGIFGKDLIAVKDAFINIESEGDGIKVTNDTEVGKGNLILESGTYIINADSDGIPAEKSLTILDGTFNITSAKDSIHSNNSVSIYNGVFEISSEDDGIHTDKTIDISGGTININKSYEGIESSVINIMNGNVRITSQDDGIVSARYYAVTFLLTK